jgi:hypothetical protein
VLAGLAGDVGRLRDVLRRAAEAEDAPVQRFPTVADAVDALTPAR